MSYTPRNPNGQATMANSEPVVIASDQSTLPVSGTFFQATQPVSATDLDIRNLVNTDVVTAELSAVDNAVLDAIAASVAAIDADTTTIIGHVDGIEALLATIDADTGSILTSVDGLETSNSAIQTAVQLIDDTVVTLGTATYAEATSAGLAIGAVRRDADTTLVNTTNEWGPLQMDANGRLKTEVFSGETLPVSLTSTTITGTVAVTQSGTWDEVGINDSGNSITVDAPVATPVYVRLSDGAAAITTLPVSLASVPSHAVTNAGTFAVQSTNQANSGVDIGDVTINNAAGASAVNIQDGGNTITVDGTVAATQSGTWTVQPGNTANSTAWLVSDRPSTSGGLSKFHLVGAATTNATNVKASAGQVYSVTAFNLNAAPAYLKFHNTAGTPTAGSGVTDTFLIPGNTAGAGLVINFDKGIAFSTGIGITLVTGIADANASAIAASEVVVNIYYS